MKKAKRVLAFGLALLLSVLPATQSAEAASSVKRVENGIYVQDEESTSAYRGVFAETYQDGSVDRHRNIVFSAEKETDLRDLKIVYIEWAYSRPELAVSEELQQFLDAHGGSVTVTDAPEELALPDASELISYIYPYGEGKAKAICIHADGAYQGELLTLDYPVFPEWGRWHGYYVNNERVASCCYRKRILNWGEKDRYLCLPDLEYNEKKNGKLRYEVRVADAELSDLEIVFRKATNAVCTFTEEFQAFLQAHAGEGTIEEIHGDGAYKYYPAFADRELLRIRIHVDGSYTGVILEMKADYKDDDDLLDMKMFADGVNCFGNFETRVDDPIEKGKVSISDVDGDDEITAADALLVLRSIVGLQTMTEEQKECADWNMDGEVTAVDALLILKKIVGLI